MVLGIEVDDDLLERWREWLMPKRQPYVIEYGLADELALTGRIGPVSPELRDSFELYSADDVVVWLNSSQARSLPADVRAMQPSAHRWRSRDPAETTRRIVRYVELGRRPSRHTEVEPVTWRELADSLPLAECLAGTFPDGSGPNCFGTVMAVAGVAEAEKIWMQRDPFENWLAEYTAPGGRDDEAGTILVWRSADGLVQHAAVTLGDRWALHKPSQGWMSPTKVLRVSDMKFSARTPGRYLHRRRLR